MEDMGLRVSQHLIETNALQDFLDDPRLRVFDCSVTLTPTAEDPFARRSGRDAWLQGHVPGAGFLDLEGEYSATSPVGLHYAVPDPQTFASLAGGAGIGPKAMVVLYSSGHPMWATRVWWMLRVHGFDNALVLNGGWERWVREGRPQSVGESTYSPDVFPLRWRPELFADKERVVAAVARGDAVLVNTLTHKQHHGGGLHYGRPGRIPGSMCVPALSLTERSTGNFLPIEALRSAMQDVLDLKKPVIAYCGAGIAAACGSFVLSVLGREDVAVYDGSLEEWSRDASLPMESG
jgi:thiosulfate/3-mercaptopyruvate sulfurtransferase